MTDATISYVILSHRDAPQVLRLARTIRAMSLRARVLIRHNQPPGFIDARCAEASGADLLVSGVQCRWGNWSLVEASLEACRYVREVHDPDWIVLISGQDYPVRPLDRWEATLLTDGSDAVMSGEPLVSGPFGRVPGGARDRLKMRYTHYWYWLPRLGIISRLPRRLRRLVRSGWFKCIYPLQAMVVLNALPRHEGWALAIRRRRVPWSPDMPVYKGSQWIALSRRAADACLDGSHARRLRSDFARTLVPDEAYFQTVLASMPGMSIRFEPVSWLRWEDDVTPHPAVIGEPDLDAAIEAGTPFARKFDESDTPGILDLIDRTLLLESGARHET